MYLSNFLFTVAMPRNMILPVIMSNISNQIIFKISINTKVFEYTHELSVGKKSLNYVVLQKMRNHPLL